MATEENADVPVTLFDVQEIPAFVETQIEVAAAVAAILFPSAETAMQFQEPMEEPV